MKNEANIGFLKSEKATEKRCAVLLKKGLMFFEKSLMFFEQGQGFFATHFAHKNQTIFPAFKSNVYICKNIIILF